MRYTQWHCAIFAHCVVLLTGGCTSGCHAGCRSCLSRHLPRTRALNAHTPAARMCQRSLSRLRFVSHVGEGGGKPGWSHPALSMSSAVCALDAEIGPSMTNAASVSARLHCLLVGLRRGPSSTSSSSGRSPTRRLTSARAVPCLTWSCSFWPTLPRWGNNGKMNDVAARSTPT
jgi:hypothetical protein